MEQQSVQNCIVKEELKIILQQSSEQILIIDVRSPEEYAEKNIPGAINIPLSELENHSKEFTKDTIIVTACGKGGGRSAQAAELLQRIGFNNAVFLCGGTFGWHEKI